MALEAEVFDSAGVAVGARAREQLLVGARSGVAGVGGARIFVVAGLVALDALAFDAASDLAGIAVLTVLGRPGDLDPKAALANVQRAVVLGADITVIAGLRVTLAADADADVVNGARVAVVAERPLRLGCLVALSRRRIALAAGADVADAGLRQAFARPILAEIGDAALVAVVALLVVGDLNAALGDDAGVVGADVAVVAVFGVAGAFAGLAGRVHLAGIAVVAGCAVARRRHAALAGRDGAGRLEAGLDLQRRAIGVLCTALGQGDDGVEGLADVRGGVDRVLGLGRICLGVGVGRIAVDGRDDVCAHVGGGVEDADVEVVDRRRQAACRGAQHPQRREINQAPWRP